jgi:hypothetical protein
MSLSQTQYDNLNCLLSRFMNEASQDPNSEQTKETYAVLESATKDYDVVLYSTFFNDKETCHVASAALLRSLLHRCPNPEPQEIAPDTPKGVTLAHNDYGFGQLIENLTTEDGTRIVLVKFQSQLRAQYMKQDERYLIWPADSCELEARAD